MIKVKLFPDYMGEQHMHKIEIAPRSRIRLLHISIICIMFAGSSMWVLSACTDNRNVGNDAMEESASFVSSDNSSIISGTLTAEPTFAPVDEPTSAPDKNTINFHFDLIANDISTAGRALYLISGEKYLDIVGNNGILTGINEKSGNFEDIIRGKPDGSKIQFSIDGISFAVIFPGEPPKMNKLYYCDGKTAIEIASGVDSYCLSNDGSAVAYLTGTYEPGVGGTLYVRDCPTGIARIISEGAGRQFILSPGGESIAYTTYYEENNPEAITCLVSVQGKEAREAGKDIYPAALTDDGKTGYFVKKTSTAEEFYASHDDKIRLLCADSGKNDSYPFAKYLFNNDCTQVIYSDNTNTYFSMDAGEPVLVFSGRNVRFAGANNSYAEFSGTKNLCDVLFYVEDGDSFCYFNEKMKTKTFSTEETIQQVVIRNHEVLFNCDSGSKLGLITNYLASNAQITYVSGYKPGALIGITSAKTIFYNSAPAGQGGMFSELHMIRPGLEAVLVMNETAGITLLEKEQEPDVLFFLAPDPDSVMDNNSPGYDQYFNLYSLTDAEGAAPVLVNTMVCKVETGDFGVVYQKYAGNSGGKNAAGEIRDVTDFYYSPSGQSFTVAARRDYIYNPDS